MNDELIRSHMRDNGFAPPPVFDDRSFQRFSRSGGKDRNSFVHIESEWAVYGDWSTGEKHYVFSDSNYRSDPKKAEMIRIAQEAWERTRREEVAKATEQALAVYTSLDPIRHHPYAVSKKVDVSEGIRLGKRNRMVIPLHDMDGNFRSVQTIDENGGKMFAADTSLKGAFYEFKGESPTIICEGWATGASIRAALPNRVLCAMSASNIKAVYGDLPETERRNALIFADWDPIPKGWSESMARTYPKGTGEKGAVESGCPKEHIFFPIRQGDFNDMALSGKSIAEWWRNRQALSEFSDINDLLSDDSPMEYLIEDWIPEESIGIVYGKPGCYKTTLILDMVSCVAVGMPWKRWETGKGQVLYCCGEGFSGLKKRVKAWQVRNGCRFDPNSFRVYKLDSNLIDLRHHLETLKDEGFHPSVVVLDTLNFYVDGDENSTQDMTAFIRKAASFTRDFQCSLILLHHTSKNKDNPEDMRGSSAIMGGIDFAIFCEKNKDNSQMRIKHAKMKDGEQMPETAFSIVKVDIEDWRRDKFGKMQSACVIGEETDWMEQAPSVETPFTDESMLMFKKVVESCGGVIPSRMNDLAPILNQTGMAMGDFRRIKMRMIAKGALVLNSDGNYELS